MRGMLPESTFQHKKSHSNLYSVAKVIAPERLGTIFELQSLIIMVVITLAELQIAQEQKV